MPDLTHWQASQMEQRAAVIIAACCIIMVFAASLRPQWFDISWPEFDSRQSSDSQVVEPLQQEPLQPLVETAPTAPQSAVTPAQTSPQRAAAAPAPVISPATTLPASIKPVVTRRPPLAKPSVTTGYYVQLGAFKEQARAKGLADRLSHLGWPSHIIVRGQLHAVWAGPATTREKAEQLQKAIAAKLGNEGFIFHQQGA